MLLLLETYEIIKQKVNRIFRILIFFRGIIFIQNGIICWRFPRKPAVFVDVNVIWIDTVDIIHISNYIKCT